VLNVSAPECGEIIDPTALYDAPIISYVPAEIYGVIYAVKISSPVAVGDTGVWPI
jgi:hypothetical protein